jgi:hypothetical protein
VRELPVPLGFYLLRGNEHPYGWPDVIYRGIDRLPLFPTPEEEKRLMEEERHELLKLWDELSDIEYDPINAFNRSGLVSLRAAFKKEGIVLELVFGEIVATPPDLTRYKRGVLWGKEFDESLARWRQLMPTQISKDNRLTFLGYDVSHPFPTFHSAINQPMFTDERDSIRLLINRNGLAGTVETASALMDKANELEYGPLPFCVIAVSADSNQRP